MSKAAYIEADDDDIDNMDFDLPTQVPAPKPQASTSKPKAAPSWRPQYAPTAAPPSARPPTSQHLPPPASAEEIKAWQVIYPIYLDAKQPHRKGARRVSKSRAVEWPSAVDIMGASWQLGLRAQLERNKTHPQDWANPGRVRVEIKRNGKSVSSRCPDKQALLNAISELIQADHKNGKRWIPGQTPHIQGRLPPQSPAVSHGVLEMAKDEKEMEEAMKMMMPPGMAERLPPPAAEGEAARPLPIPQKPKVVRVRARRK